MHPKSNNIKSNDQRWHRWQQLSISNIEHYKQSCVIYVSSILDFYSGDTFHTGQDCANYHANYDFSWADVQCTVSAMIICESA